MSARLCALRRSLGPVGTLACVLLILAGAFHLFAVQPLQARDDALQARLARQAPAPSKDAALPASSAEKVEKVYRHLQKGEEVTDWLAKLHGIGLATGVQLRAGTYRTQKTSGAIVRHEIVLPVSGGYPQIREFLQRSLAEIPVMSIDQVSLKRPSRNEAAVQAELRVTLHMVQS